MKLSPQTLAVIKNFATVNVNLAFQSGKQIRTIGPARNIFAKAEVPDSFPKDFAIYDLNSFIQAITLFDDADLEFGEKFVVINYGTSSIKYFYSDPSIVAAAPNKEIVVDSDIFTCEFTKSMVNALMKASTVLSAPQISFVSKKGKVDVLVSDVKNTTSHSFNFTIGANENNFNVVLRVENFKLLEGNYTCTISKKGTAGVVKWVNKEVPLSYWMTIEQGSVI